MKASGADLLRVVHRVFFSLTLIDGVDPQAAWIALQRKTCTRRGQWQSPVRDYELDDSIIFLF